MTRYFTGIGLACWLLTGVTCAQGDRVANGRADKPDRTDVSESQPITVGYVIVKGEYFPPPYIVKKQGNRVFVNDHVLSTANARRGPRGRGKRGGGFRGPSRHPKNHGPSLAEAEESLQRDQLLIVLDDETANFLEPADSIDVLAILLSDAKNAGKVESLANAPIDGISRKEWAKIVEVFKPPQELEDRVRPIVAQMKKQVEEDAAASKRLLSRAYLSSPSVRYVVTLVAMGLVVVAFGNLLSHHPKRGVRWRDVDSNGDDVGMVKRNATLLILLGIFDLACTTLAGQAGGFLELNPLGGQMMSDPITLAAFKITTLAGACGILLLLRKYRGAQVASWWMCLVVTVVALRWLTYNSMFLA